MARRRHHHDHATAWIWCLALLAMAKRPGASSSSSSSSSTTPAQPPFTPAAPPAGAVPKMNTGGPSWKADRLAELSLHGITGDVAKSILAQWGMETAFGAGEWNWNVGNIVWTPGYVPVDIGPQISRAYPNLSAGVADWLVLVKSSRYAKAWADLNARPLDSTWARELSDAGYAPNPVAYENAYKGARARV